MHTKLHRLLDNYKCKHTFELPIGGSVVGFGGDLRQQCSTVRNRPGAEEAQSVYVYSGLYSTCTFARSSPSWATSILHTCLAARDKAAAVLSS